MRALQLIEAHTIEVRDVPVPEIASDEVLVRVAGAGLCHSDLHVLHADEWPVTPMTLGHETAGRIERLGANVVGHAEGDPCSCTWCGRAASAVPVCRGATTSAARPRDASECRPARAWDPTAAWPS